MAQELFPEPPRPEGQTDVIELRCDPIETVRIAFIGVGGRGTGAVRRYTFLEGVKIVALCDLVPENLEKAQEILKDSGLPPADTYTGSRGLEKSVRKRRCRPGLYLYPLGPAYAHRCLCHGAGQACGH